MEKKLLKIIAPAKVNLFLAVGPKVSSDKIDLSEDFVDVNDGYHPVLNIMHTILLHDVLFMSYFKSPHFKLSVRFLDSSDVDQPVPVPEVEQKENIVYKAITMLINEFPQKNHFEISVLIEKNIPHKAGLGGGSSDAAAALVGACNIFGIDVNCDKVIKIAKELGADVPFFLKGGCALMTGSGDVLDHCLQPINRDIMLVKPNSSSIDDGLSTKDVYFQFDKMPEFFADLSGKDIEIPFPENQNNSCECGHHTNTVSVNMVDAVKQLQFADEVPLVNNLAWASEALMPELSQIKKVLQKKYGYNNVLLCGSGSATFVITPEDMDFDNEIKPIIQKGYWVVPTQLANVKARIVPLV